MVTYPKMTQWGNLNTSLSANLENNHGAAVVFFFFFYTPQGDSGGFKK